MVANTINIAADLAAMGEALNARHRRPAIFYALVFGGICLVLEVFIPYHRYAGILKFTDAGAAGLCGGGVQRAHPVGRGRARDASFRSVSLDRDMILTVVAVFGTTISPYLFFWQASQEAEESRLSHRVRANAATDEPASIEGARFAAADIVTSTPGSA